MSTTEDRAQLLGARIAERRKDLGWSLAEVARRTGLSRAYIHALEKGRGKRPGADVVRKLEEVLGPLTDSRKVRPPTPPSLEALAKERSIPDSEIAVLAALRVRGEPPRTLERWRFIYDALLASESMDHPSNH
ncbi:MAG: helix-turn-helix transcriptional regulator [Actinomycetota bacterium]|nr:helix-turn-helix transcriptional regulator [Actinomycetota bacterium]MDQ3956375.1 helix-turn-helix transcriptional regulator [Actinomycetota bacterium]